MENYRERIIKYLSELMDEKEKISFEEELKKSEFLKMEFDRVNDSLRSLDYSYTDADEKYFVNLLPKVRTRIDTPVKKSFLIRFGYAVPVVAAVFAGLIMFQHNLSNEITSKKIVQEIVNNINDENVSDNYLSDLDFDINNSYDSTNEELQNIKPVNVDDVSKQEIMNAYYYPINEEIITVQNLSVEEIRNILTKID